MSSSEYVAGRSPDTKARRIHRNHDKGTPRERPAPTTRPTAKSKNGRCRCPGCGTWWTGLAWGDSCPKCKIVRMPQSGWWPWDNPRIDDEELLRDGSGHGRDLVDGGEGR